MIASDRMNPLIGLARVNRKPTRSIVRLATPPTSAAITTARANGTPAGHGRPGGEAADRDDLPVGEVDQVGEAVDERHADGDQRIHAADHHPVDELLEELLHVCL